MLKSDTKVAIVLICGLCSSLFTIVMALAMHKLRMMTRNKKHKLMNDMSLYNSKFLKNPRCDGDIAPISILTVFALEFSSNKYPVAKDGLVTRILRAVNTDA